MQKACDEMNKVRARVGLGKVEAMNPELNLTANKDNFIEQLLKERACEFGYEDSRWYDLIRYKRSDIFKKQVHQLRVWRKDANGNTRELHTELAKGAIDYTVLPDYRTKYEQVQDRETELVSCPYFTTSLCDLTAPLTLDYAALDSFVVVICVEGKGMIADDSGNEMPIHQGETVLLPATVKSLRVVPEGKLKMLTSCIK